MSKQIKLMEFLVDKAIDNLNEQFFSPSMATARIKGKANIGWTDCFQRRCGDTNDKYARDLCKEYCKRDAAQDALGNVRGLIGDCPKAKNPKSCADSVRRTAESWNKRISRIDDRIADLKRNIAKMKQGTK
jgi:hypothetical protein